VKVGDLDEPCEWAPQHNREAICADESHGEARYVIGIYRPWRLCESCVRLPRFHESRKAREVRL
jgi:hypothetical protein